MPKHPNNRSWPENLAFDFELPMLSPAAAEAFISILPTTERNKEFLRLRYRGGQDLCRDCRYPWHDARRGKVGNHCHAGEVRRRSHFNTGDRCGKSGAAVRIYTDGHTAPSRGRTAPCGR